MPGLNYGLGTAAFIPPKGIVLEAIDPAKICEGTGLEKCSIPEKKKTQHRTPGRGTRRLKNSGVDTAKK